MKIPNQSVGTVHLPSGGHVHAGVTPSLFTRSRLDSGGGGLFFPDCEWRQCGTCRTGYGQYWGECPMMCYMPNEAGEGMISCPYKPPYCACASVGLPSPGVLR